jgi:CheY-like chemotaxis protein
MKNTPQTHFASLIQEFFLERLMRQRNSSPQTVAAYRDCFRLLFEFAREHRNKPTDRLVLTDLDAPLVLAFLDHLEKVRKNSIRSRNARLAAIRSFLRFAVLKDPQSLATIQRALTIPIKRHSRPLVGFLSREEVVEAENGADALKKLAGLTPDLIVTDLNMPVMDGMTFIRGARALPAARYIPILMLTTESQAEKKAEAKAAGATGWIVKPFDPPKLLAVIGKVLP